MTHVARHRGLLLTLVGLAAVVLAGCRQFPTDNKPVPSPVSGSYVGVVNLEGGDTNVIVVLAGPDSAGQFSGAIYYRGRNSTFSQTTVNAAADSVQFRYLRLNTLYVGVAVVTSTSLVITLATPTGIPAFHVNRELLGYNLTGTWSGSMYSALTEITHGATMSLDQSGQLFQGSIESNFLQTYQFQITSGAANQNAFQMTGTAHIAAQDFPTLFVGYYTAVDTVTGTWQAGQNAEIDHGDFVFVRLFN